MGLAGSKQIQEKGKMTETQQIPTETKLGSIGRRSNVSSKLISGLVNAAGMGTISKKEKRSGLPSSLQEKALKRPRLLREREGETGYRLTIGMYNFVPL